MDKAWLKERIQKPFLLIQSRPFIMLILLSVVLSTFLRIIAPYFLVLCFIATLASLALGTGDFLAFVLKAGDFTFGLNKMEVRSSSSEVSVQQGGNHGFEAARPPMASWRSNFAHGFQRVSYSSFDFVKRHVLADIDEEGLLAAPHEAAGPNLQGYMHIRKSSNKEIEEEGEEEEAAAAKNESASENGKSIVCRHEVCHVTTDEKPNACLQHDDEAGDVPELEDCSSTSGGEEEVCKSVLETSAHASGRPSLHVNMVLGDILLRPTSNQVDAHTVAEDDNSIDKHQILPLETCKHCKIGRAKGFYAFDMLRKCQCFHSSRGLEKLQVTDAELQDAASEFYTMEGDVLWSEADLKKKPDCKRVDNASDMFLRTSCELCKHGMFPVSSGDFSILPSKACRGTKTTVATHKPPSAKLVYYVDAMRGPEGNGCEASLCGSADDKELNEDVIIDQELRAIASRSGNRGEESNYMSTAGSFRDFVGSFREFDACWSEYGMMGSKEDVDFLTGCCDDHAKPCISHSRSRSKVLQSDPLLSKTSLIREQEIMDVLWQEYDEDRRQRYNNLGKLRTDHAPKHRSRGGVDLSGSSAHVVPQDDRRHMADSAHVHANNYVMKFNNASDYDSYDISNGDPCRLGCDKPCWHMAKERSYHRRRHFVGFCKLFRELGLKQCIQSSKVDK